MKLVIRNTSRDRTTAALRKARPGDVQPYPTIKNVRLPPGGSIHVASAELTFQEADALSVLISCGCLRVFVRPGSGPMKELTADEVMALAPVVEPAGTVIHDEGPEPVKEPAPEPIPEDIGDADTEDIPPYLESELKAMKNAELRGILSQKDFTRTSGMNKSALVAKILELQEA